MTLARRFVRTVLGFGALAVATVLLAPLVGPTPIDFRRAFDFSIPFSDNVDAQIFFVARLPRTLAGACVGALFAGAGVVFQGLLRNPLATPFTLGVSTGAALGAVLAITFNWSLGFIGISAVPVAAFVGSLMAVAIVYALAQARHRGLSTTVLLLAGVTMNAFFSAMILFVQYLASFADTYRTLRWLMGDLDVSSYQPILAALPTSARRVCGVRVAGAPAEPALGRPRQRRIARTRRRESPACGVPERVARYGGRGLDRRSDRIRRHHHPAPDPADRRTGSPSRAAGAILFGAAFLVGCDLVARTILAPVELPVGIITALLGGPFFLWLLIRKP